MYTNGIFNESYMKKLVSNLSNDTKKEYLSKKKIAEDWIKTLEDSIRLKRGEKQLQSSFLLRIFSDLLGYKDISQSCTANIIMEQSTKIDGTKPDGIIGIFDVDKSKTLGVIELKSPNVNLDEKQKRHNDNRTPVEQAFSYAPKYGASCQWVIVSNFNEIRLYNSSSQLEFEQFYISDMNDDIEFLRFYYILSKKNLISNYGKSSIENLYDHRIQKEQEITKEFYLKYRSVRSKLIVDIQSNNEIENFEAIDKAQKILDRIIFICFCKDSSEQLLPKDILERIFNPKEPSLKECLWDDLKELFQAIDSGNKRNDINRYNGGLFKYDPELDDLKISDNALNELKRIVNCDFDKELGSEILGHILEQSITDIDTLKNHGGSGNLKRKENGIYYTPKDVIEYMVKQSVGRWIENKKVELGYDSLPVLTEDEKDAAIKLVNNNYKIGSKKTNNSKLYEKYMKILNFWESYREQLFNIKVIDISCGSGAFLNRVFLYLYNEMCTINRTIMNLRNGQDKIYFINDKAYLDIDKHILSNNIFGVDLNKTSVEITKLSLWLLTATKNKPLVNLDNNIYFGDSLVDNNKIARDAAFNWNIRFKDVLDSGGFDIVIGNPPYIDSEQMAKTHKEIREYCRKKYKTTKGNWDIYVPFIEKGINLLKSDGIISYIVPNKLIGAPYAKSIRNEMEKYTLIGLKDLSDVKVFSEADVYTVIFSLQKSQIKSDAIIEKYNNEIKKWDSTMLKGDTFAENFRWNRCFINNSKVDTILDKIVCNTKLGAIAKVKEAATVKEAYEIKEVLYDIKDNKWDREKQIKLINTGTIDPYVSLWGSKDTTYIKAKYIKPVVDINKLSARNLEQSKKEKIIIGGVGKKLECYLDKGEHLAGKSTKIIIDSKINLKYIIAVLNSELMEFYYKNFNGSLSLANGYLNIGAEQIINIPIAYDEVIATKIINKVDELLKTGAQESRSNQMLQEIDDLVYEIYNIGENEIRVIKDDLH